MRALSQSDIADLLLAVLSFYVGVSFTSLGAWYISTLVNPPLSTLFALYFILSGGIAGLLFGTLLVFHAIQPNLRRTEEGIP